MDIKGKTYGDLVILERAENNRHQKSRWKCKCKCGNIKIINGSDIIRGKTSSCGCKIKKHGLRNHKLHNVWRNMKYRCFNKNSKAYKNYGARGITVCKEWKNNCYSFYLWAINNGYRKELTIDRIDNNGIYEPNNCKWSTLLEQSQNRRTSIPIIYDNELYSVAAFARKFGVSKFTIYRKLKEGYKIEEIINEEEMK